MTADLLEPLVVDHATSGGIDPLSRIVDFHADLDADIRRRRGDGGVNLSVGEKAGDQRGSDKQRRPVTIGRLNARLQYVQVSNASVKCATYTYGAEALVPAALKLPLLCAEALVSVKTAARPPAKRKRLSCLFITMSFRLYVQLEKGPKLHATCGSARSSRHTSALVGRVFRECCVVFFEAWFTGEEPVAYESIASEKVGLKLLR